LFLWDLKERTQFGALGIDGKIIMKWILKKSGMTMWTEEAKDRAQ
jgi:hypothetical protein